jgi:hypothetical protein
LVEQPLEAHRPMKDIRNHLEKLRAQVVECETIRDMATDEKKRELFARLAEHFRMLAAEMERAMKSHRP